ncbi:MAG: type II toxin-antitoxin system VapC family toxin [Actinomycetota bacterium]
MSVMSSSGTSPRGLPLIVVDSSAVVHAVAIDSELGELARERLERDGDLRAPHLLDLELVSALRRMEANDEITDSRASAALDVFSLMSLRRYSHGPLLDRVWELRANVKSYDAAYIALAEALECTLVTRDIALSKIRSVRCPVEVLS